MKILSFFKAYFSLPQKEALTSRFCCYAGGWIGGKTEVPRDPVRDGPTRSKLRLLQDQKTWSSHLTSSESSIKWAAADARFLIRFQGVTVATQCEFLTCDSVIFCACTVPHILNASFSGLDHLRTMCWYSTEHIFEKKVSATANTSKKACTES